MASKTASNATVAGVSSVVGLSTAFGMNLANDKIEKLQNAQWAIPGTMLVISGITAVASKNPIVKASAQVTLGVSMGLLSQTLIDAIANKGEEESTQGTRRRGRFTRKGGRGGLKRKGSFASALKKRSRPERDRFVRDRPSSTRGGPSRPSSTRGRPTLTRPGRAQPARPTFKGAPKGQPGRPSFVDKIPSKLRSDIQIRTLENAFCDPYTEIDD